jgi:hypothetical protein
LLFGDAIIRIKPILPLQGAFLVSPPEDAGNLSLSIDLSAYYNTLEIDSLLNSKEFYYQMEIIKQSTSVVVMFI